MQMDAKNAAMQAQAMGESQGPMAEGMPMGQQMAPDGMPPLQPQAGVEVARPQSPLGGAMDASVGRAANPPIFGGQ